MSIEVVRSWDDLTDAEKADARRMWVERCGQYPIGDWWECSYDDFVRVAKILGITFSTRSKGQGGGLSIFFSIGGGQSDGVYFDGGYTCNPEAWQQMQDFAPNDATLISIASQLTVLNMTVKLMHDTVLMAAISCGHSFYNHPETVTSKHVSTGDDPAHEHEELLTTLMRAFADWMYKRLEEEYDYLHSTEFLDQELMDRSFNENGDII